MRGRTIQPPLPFTQNLADGSNTRRRVVRPGHEEGPAILAEGECLGAGIRIDVPKNRLDDRRVLRRRQPETGRISRNQAKDEAVRDWCADNDIALASDGPGSRSLSTEPPRAGAMRERGVDDAPASPERDAPYSAFAASITAAA
jgi:hypothetical protein